VGEWTVGSRAPQGVRAGARGSTSYDVTALGLGKQGRGGWGDPKQARTETGPPTHAAPLPSHDKPRREDAQKWEDVCVRAEPWARQAAAHSGPESSARQTQFCAVCTVQHAHPTQRPPPRASLTRYGGVPAPRAPHPTKAIIFHRGACGGRGPCTRHLPGLTPRATHDRVETNSPKKNKKPPSPPAPAPEARLPSADDAAAAVEGPS
jgi:hypothetical protein